MILRLVLPFVDRSVEWAKLLKWHKAEGEPVTYGEHLCDLSIQEVVQRRQEFHPRLFESILRADRKPLPEFEYTFDKLEYRVSVVSSDMGWMAKVCAKENERQQIGSLLAVLTTDPAEAVETCTDVDPGAPVFRAVANLVDPSQEVAPVLGREARR